MSEEFRTYMAGLSENDIIGRMDDHVPSIQSVEDILGTTRGASSFLTRECAHYPNFLKSDVHPISMDRFKKMDLKKIHPRSQIIWYHANDKVYAYFILTRDRFSGKNLTSVFFVMGETGIELLEKFIWQEAEKYGVSTTCSNYNELLNYLTFRRGF